MEAFTEKNSLWLNDDEPSGAKATGNNYVSL